VNRRLMMNAQFYAVAGGPVESVFGQPLRVEHFGGEFAVLEGRVWLTRRGDPEDHVLSAGDRIVLEPADDIVIEPWSRHETARLAWRPIPQAPRGERLLRDALGAVLRGVATAADGALLGLRRVEAGLDALARSAASSARRAQGCI
jgi:hypothetical protein